MTGYLLGRWGFALFLLDPPPVHYTNKISQKKYIKHMMYLEDFLEQKSGKEGNHWMKYHIIMEQLRKYENEYGVKITLLVDEK